jgi:hypothetical protein
MIAAIVILAFLASGSSCYIKNNFHSVLRTKKIEEIQNQNTHANQIVKSNPSSIKTLDMMYDQEFEEKSEFLFLFAAGRKCITLYYILAVILSAFQFYLYLRYWMIEIFQTKTGLCMVHYLQLKDGKKDALSICYSI